MNLEAYKELANIVAKLRRRDRELLDTVNEATKAWKAVNKELGEANSALDNYIAVCKAKDTEL